MRFAQCYRLIKLSQLTFNQTIKYIQFIYVAMLLIRWFIMYHHIQISKLTVNIS